MKHHVFHRPHSDAEGIDEIRIKTVPRFKTSELSGDEWRVSALCEFFRKGVKVYDRSFSSLKYAIQFLPWLVHVEMITGKDAPEAALFRADPDECHQPGCPDKAANVYRLKKIYSDTGEGPLPNESGFEYRRSFCVKHSHRGDCGLEDADVNYELVKGKGGKVIAPDDISPSGFGGVINADEFLKD